MRTLQVICHLFYPRLSEELLHKLSYLNNYKATFLFSVQGSIGEHQQLIQRTKKMFPQAFILQTPAIGRDIGAKLSLINLSKLLEINSEYSLVIHDKKSNYLPDGEKWREELYKIISPGNIQKVFDIFEKHADVGIVCSANYIQNEYDEFSKEFMSRNNEKIKVTLNKFNIVTQDYSFVAGTIFWIRSSLLKGFFQTRSISRIKAELEKGNISDIEKGTFIHTWERIFGWVATSNSQRLYGI